MKSPELLVDSGNAVELRELETGCEILGKNYSLFFRADKPYVELRDRHGELWAELFRGGEVRLHGAEQAEYATDDPEYERLEDGSVQITTRSTGINDSLTEQTWICREDRIETQITASGIEGTVENVKYFGGVYVRPNMFGDSMSQHYFRSVFNPQPSEMERRAIPATESTEITTSGMWQPGRRREFLITPPVLGFNLSVPRHGNTLPHGEWLMTGVSAPIGEQNFTRFSYEAHEDGFSLNLQYDRQQVTDGKFTSPTLTLQFADNPMSGLTGYVAAARELGHLGPYVAPAQARFHTGSTLVSWGEQLEESRRTKQPAATYASQSFMQMLLDDAVEKGLEFDKYVVDDKWQEFYGLNLPDPEKWDDMRVFNLLQREMGRYGILWCKLFDAEGLPPEECILDRNGRPISSDPTNPAYLERVEEQVQHMLSDDGLAASGLKLDFIAQLPHGPGLRWHGRERGYAALDKYLAAISRAAFATKRDALIQAQIVTPWLGEYFNQVRLNDSNDHRNVLSDMEFRATEADTLLPGHSIDPDGWPMPDLMTQLKYIEMQAKLYDTVTTHFIRSVNGEPYKPRHLRRMRRAINSLPTK